jgi:hypothetical protein
MSARKQSTYTNKEKQERSASHYPPKNSNTIQPDFWKNPIKLDNEKQIFAFTPKGETTPFFMP